MLAYIIECGQSNTAIIFPSPPLQTFTVESHIHIRQIVDKLKQERNHLYPIFHWSARSNSNLGKKGEATTEDKE